MPDPAAQPSYVIGEADRSLDYFLESSPFITADHEEIVEAAGKALGDSLDAREGSRRIGTWVYQTLQKVPVAGVPNSLEILRSKRGDCNEHTTLFTAMARAVGIPTKMAAGIVYSEAIFDDGAFYYHAWPEVWLGEGWVPVDPTFGQFPADATHVKLVEGELDQQTELLGVIGRLALEVVEAPSE